jgi:hypothetical protein
MKRWIVPAVVLAGVMLCFAGPVAAQFYPGGGYGGWGGYDGGAALLGSDYVDAQTMQLKAQSRQAAQQAAIGQNYVVQSGIRNTLSSGAQSRDAAIINQQQATQDWWFQQQQQRAQRPSADYSMAAPAVGWSGMAPANRRRPAAMDIIKWPVLLQEPCFESERTKIEAPYRRKPPTPSEEDYREMASTVEDMKASLQWRLGEGVDTNDYNVAKAFLDQLGGEVAKRIK